MESTILIKLINNKAIKLLRDMEELDLISVLDENIETKKVKLSDKYKNVFTKEDAKDFIKHTESKRKEWENTL
jgi:hypothetical protein